MKSPSHSEPIRDEELEALLSDCLDLLLTTLPPEQARVVRAIDMGGALPQSVADMLGLSLNEVTNYLALGRQGLEDRFGQMHMICPEHGLECCDCHSKGNSGA